MQKIKTNILIGRYRHVSLLNICKKVYNKIVAEDCGCIMQSYETIITKKKQLIILVVIQ